MTKRNPAHRALIAGSSALAGIALLAGAAAPVLAQVDGPVGARHAAWRGCLHRNFGLQVMLTGRVLAADSALRACRVSETAYLSALADSPMVDGDDVARVRPALLQRAKGWLLTGRLSAPL